MKARIKAALESMFVYLLIFAIAYGGMAAVQRGVGLIQSSPRLVGHGCVGTHGDIYAEEEDDFPRCASIEAR